MVRVSVTRVHAREALDVPASCVCLRHSMTAAVHGGAQKAGDESLYALSVDQTSVRVFDTVTVAWKIPSGAACSHNDNGCYDWIAPFQVGACNGTGPIPEDTCYAENNWAWISSSGRSWSTSFDGPGERRTRRAPSDGQ